MHVFQAVDTETFLAPEPEDILWDNLHMAPWTKYISRIVIAVSVFMLVLFWSIPVAFVSR
jgi:hypothetical protein